ncbi:MAG: nucleotide exchange factor GrpE [Clostridia bacterium]|nr:nucleotide exchange factor GrpE [Clostridia bacterium]
MEENKTPVEETVKEAPPAETADAPAEAKAEAATPESERKHKAREEKRELAAAKEKAAELEKALAEEKEKYLRMFAEYDNFRRRSQKERDGIYTDAVSDVVGAILPIADNLERAGRYSDGDGEKVAEGLRLTMNALSECLTKLGVTAFGEVGDKFDPNLHNAIMHEEDEAKGEGEIVEVFQPGYRRGDKIIRYAMVKVAN